MNRAVQWALAALVVGICAAMLAWGLAGAFVVLTYLPAALAIGWAIWVTAVLRDIRNELRRLREFQASPSRPKDTVN